ISYCYLGHRLLHSFPTRRSSDLLEPALDPAVRVEDEGLRGHAWGKRVDLLRGDRIEPGQTVRPAQAQHPQVREVDEAVLLFEHALLAQGGAVVQRGLRQ